MKRWFGENLKGAKIDITNVPYSPTPALEEDTIYLYIQNDNFEGIIISKDGFNVLLPRTELPQDLATIPYVDGLFNRTQAVATPATNGLMSWQDKSKLDGMKTYNHPIHQYHPLGLYEIEIDNYGHVITAVPYIPERNAMQTRRVDLTLEPGETEIVYETMEPRDIVLSSLECSSNVYQYDVMVGDESYGDDVYDVYVNRKKPFRVHLYVDNSISSSASININYTYYEE